MTHDNKQKFWFFYAKEDPYDENSPYTLYAFTDDVKIADSFVDTRCMERFYSKTEKLDRQNYNELIRHYMMCELELYKGNCKLDSGKVRTFCLPITKHEKQRIITDISVYLHEKLFQYVWNNIYILKDKYLKALSILGYPGLQTYITLGDNPISRSVEDSLMSNDMNILLDNFGWTFVSEKRSSG